MYYVYVLKSIRHNRFYTGQTNNLYGRLQLHNSEKVTYTRRYAPWKIVYKEIFLNREEAARREHYLKTHAGRNWLKKYGPLVQW